MEGLPLRKFTAISIICTFPENCVKSEFAITLEISNISGSTQHFDLKFQAVLYSFSIFTHVMLQN